MVFHAVSKMEEVLFLSLESPEKFFKDTEKTKMLFDQLKNELDLKSDESAGTGGLGEGKARTHVTISPFSACIIILFDLSLNSSRREVE